MSDLSPNVANQLLTNVVSNVNSAADAARFSNQEVNSLLARSSAKAFDELGVVEGRSVSGIVATPLAGPVKQA